MIKNFVFPVIFFLMCISTFKIAILQAKIFGKSFKNAKYVSITIVVVI